MGAELDKLTKDLISASRNLSQREARFLVATYYRMQEDRIRAAAMVKSMSKLGEPCSVLVWLAEQRETLELEVKKSLGHYAKNDPVGKWALSITGIGPVIASGLLAYIDIERAPTAGHIWSYAGIIPNIKWGKGQKRPFNQDLKVLCWKIGQSFVKTCNLDSDVYGKIYKLRKEYETAKNEAGDYAEQARELLSARKYDKDTVAYKSMIEGKLSPGHIQQRCERYATKLFLAHLHDVWYRYHFKQAPPIPYAIAILNHAHLIEVPNNPHIA